MYNTNIPTIQITGKERNFLPFFIYNNMRQKRITLATRFANGGEIDPPIDRQTQLNTNPNRLKNESKKSYDTRVKYNAFKLKQEEDKNPVKKYWNKVEEHINNEPNYFLKSAEQIATSPIRFAKYLNDKLDINNVDQYRNDLEKSRVNQRGLSSALDTASIATLPVVGGKGIINLSKVPLMRRLASQAGTFIAAQAPQDLSFGMYDQYKENSQNQKADGGEMKPPIRSAYENELMSKVITERNKDKNFVQRALSPNDYPSIINKDGSKTTHLMQYSTDNSGNAFVSPSVVQGKLGLLSKLSPREAVQYGRKTGEEIIIPNVQLADYYASNGLIKHADGGRVDNNLNTKYNNYLNDNMKQYAQGGQLTRFDEGGTHEQNPNGGIPQGQDNQGNINTVEQGESKKGNFIYSNRIALDKGLVKQFNLPAYVANKSVSDASKAIDDKFKDRQDKYAQETKNTLLDRLSQAQEYLKQQEQAQQEQANQSMQTNSQQVPDMMNGQIPEGMEEYVEQPQMQGVQEDQMMQGQAMQPSSPIAAFGGYQVKRYDGGGRFSSMNTLDPNAGVGYTFGQQGINTGATGAAAGMTGAQIGAGALGAAGTAMELGKLAFGKPAQDTSGQAASAKVDSVGMIGGSALKGAQAGMAFGPWGAAIGGGVGLIAGIAGSGKAKKAAIENSNNFATNVNKQFSDNVSAYGGELTVDKFGNNSNQYVGRYNIRHDLGGPFDVNIQDQFNQDPLQAQILKNAGYKRPSLDYKYSKLSPSFINPGQPLANLHTKYGIPSSNEGFGKKFGPASIANADVARAAEGRPLGTKYATKEDYLSAGLNSIGQKFNRNKFKNTDTSVPESIGYKSNIVTSPNTEIKKTNSEDKLGSFISDNYGQAMRYSPVAMNAYQLSQLKKPTGVNYQTLDNKFVPQYVDEAQLQRNVDQEYNNQINAISQSGGSEGAVRSSILGAGLNKAKALNDAYITAGGQNRAMDIQGQTFNLGVDQYNNQLRNKAIDEGRADDAAYRSAKSKLLASIGNDVGNIGKEEQTKQQAAQMLGYTWKGKYLVDPKTGEKITNERLARDKAAANATNTSITPTLKKGDKYMDENGVIQTLSYGGYLRTNKKGY